MFSKKDGIKKAAEEATLPLTEIREAPIRIKADTFHQMMIRHKPANETWSFKTLPLVLTGFASFSALYAPFFFRTQMNLQHFGRINSYLPSVYMGGCAGIFNVLLVQDPLTNGKATCPICHALRSSFIQVMVGSIVPIFTASMCSFYFAKRYGTYTLPDDMFTSRKGLKILGRIWWMLTNQPGGMKVFALLGMLNAAVGYLGAQEQQMTVYKVIQKHYDNLHAGDHLLSSDKPKD